MVTKCNHPEEVIANCDHLENDLGQHDIEKLIITVRGDQVLIDQDIARIYGVTTKRLNEQAKRNIARFPNSFRFELTKEEVNEVVANCDHLQYHYECFRSYASFYGSECRHLNEDSSSGKTSDRNRPKDSANLSKNINFCAISFGN